jgi:hypothetical protein
MSDPFFTQADDWEVCISDFGAWGATAGYAWLEAQFFSRQARCYSLFRLSGLLTGGIGAGDVEIDPDNWRFITCLNGFSMGALLLLSQKVAVSAPEESVFC